MNELRSMFIAGHQPHYLPWIGYFHKIFSADRFCLVDTVQYRKKYFQNRTKIRDAKAEVWLTVPVKTSGKYFQPISEVEIDNSVPWRRKHWKTINIAYNKAPYFTTYASFFEDVYRREWQKLVDLDEYLIKNILGFLGVEREIIRASSFNPQGAKTDLLIDICKKTGSGGYLSGTGGAREYVELSKFDKAGLQHRFQEFEHPIYSQIQGAFIPRFSIIDLLFNCGPESGKIIRGATSSHGHH